RGHPFFVMVTEGHEPFAEGTGGMVAWRAITPGYFAALDTPMWRGRAFTEEDRRSGTDVVILSRSLASRLFPAEDPIPKRICGILDANSGTPWKTVTGVAEDVKNAGLAAADSPEYYVLRQPGDTDDRRGSSILVRSSADPHSLANWIRTEVAALDPTVPLKV